MGLLTKAWKETLRIEDYCDKEKVIAIVKALLYEFEETHGLHHYNAMRLFDPNAGVGQRLYDLHNKMKLMEDYLGVVVVKEPEKVHYSKRTK